MCGCVGQFVMSPNKEVEVWLGFRPKTLAATRCRLLLTAYYRDACPPNGGTPDVEELLRAGSAVTCVVVSWRANPCCSHAHHPSLLWLCLCLCLCLCLLACRRVAAAQIQDPGARLRRLPRRVRRHPPRPPHRRHNPGWLLYLRRRRADRPLRCRAPRVRLASLCDGAERGRAHRVPGGTDGSRWWVAVGCAVHGRAVALHRAAGHGGCAVHHRHPQLRGRR